MGQGAATVWVMADSETPKPNHISHTRLECEDHIKRYLIPVFECGGQVIIEEESNYYRAALLVLR